MKTIQNVDMIFCLNSWKTLECFCHKIENYNIIRSYTLKYLHTSKFLTTHVRKRRNYHTKLSAKLRRYDFAYNIFI